jgi:MSHA biogenesis protein MshM
MYLYRYGMNKLPFGLTPDTEFFCPLQTHVEALNVLNFALNSGEALIKVIGEVGTGKTMLCRLLLNQLETNNDKSPASQKAFVAYIPYPKLSATELKFSLARELGIRISRDCREDQLSQRIQSRLINLNKKHGRVILLIDEAQLLNDDCLESLRLFTNLETEQRKLIQLVLFAQPELDQNLAKPHLRQIKQRIMFSYQLKKLTRPQIRQYVLQRLSVVNNNKIKLSFLASCWLKHYSNGVPRLVNILCHKALLLSFGQNKQTISCINLIRAAKDTESINTWLQDRAKLMFSLVALLSSSSAMAYWFLGSGMIETGIFNTGIGL